jgi:beta-lactamase class C
MSKGFASVLTGILVQEKSLGWDDKVIKYLPGFKLKSDSSTKNLTIRHILSHTSGLPIHTFTNLIEQGLPYSSIIYELRTVDISAPVGKEFAYQNVIFSLISDIILAASHKTYGNLLHEKIFNPLGMSDASVGYIELKDDNNLAKPHIRIDSSRFTYIKNKNIYDAVLPAAGVNASISDMSKWLMALLGERNDVVNSKTLDEIYKVEIETPWNRHYNFYHWQGLKKAGYGLGWRILFYKNDTLIYHGGTVNGYRSEIAFCPSRKIGIVILSNASGELVNDGVTVFFDLYNVRP